MKEFYISFLFSLVFLNSCNPTSSSSPLAIQEDIEIIATEEFFEIVDAVTPRPVTKDNLILLLTSGTYQERINAISAIPGLEINPQEVLPYLIENLNYDGGSPVRKATAIVIGRMGQDAETAVPALVRSLGDEGSSVPVQREAITALGKIRHPSAIPFLAEMLYFEKRDPVLADKTSSLRAAEAIELILDLDFTDQKNNSLDSEGIPIIVVEAIVWWEDEGQFQNWPMLPDE